MVSTRQTQAVVVWIRVALAALDETGVMGASSPLLGGGLPFSTYVSATENISQVEDTHITEFLFAIILNSYYTVRQ